MCNCPTPTCPVRETIGFFTTQLQSFCVKFLSLIYYILHLPPPPFLSSLFTKKDECFVTFVRIWLIFVVFGVKNRSGGGDCRHPVVGVRQYVDKHGTTFVLPQIATFSTLGTLILPKPTFDSSRITIFPRAKRRCRQSAYIYALCGRRCDSRKPHRARGKLCTIDKNHVDNHGKVKLILSILRYSSTDGTRQICIYRGFRVLPFGKQAANRYCLVGRSLSRR